MAPNADNSDARRATPAAISDAAALWVVRQDRGLSQSERSELESWLGCDPRHAAEFERLGGAWSGLGSLQSFPELESLADAVVAEANARRLNRHRLRRLAAPALGLAAAAALALTAWTWVREIREPVEATRHQVLASTLHRMTLPDGSLADLNGDSRIETTYTEGERRVRLLSGEAHFTVAKNTSRPFFVTAGTVTVRAVGTAFNVRLQTERIEVLVTEGKVKLEGAGPQAAASPSPAVAASPLSANASGMEMRRERTEAAPATTAQAQHAAPQADEPSLTAGQRAVIAQARSEAPRLAIATLAPAEIDEVLAWQSTRLVFNNTPLDEVVQAFNRHNAKRLRLGDPTLAGRRITGIFRSDNLDGFTRLAGAIVDVRAESSAGAEVVLWPAP